MRAALTLSLFAAILACPLFAAPAQAALRERTFVASYGSDTGTCTFGSPCKTFQYAVNNTANFGEVTAIDSAGFGPVAIGQSITITSPPGIEAGIAASQDGTSVTIQAGPSDVVVLRGLTLEGATIARFGIAFRSGAELDVIDCLIRDFNSDGILVIPSANAAFKISNSSILSNAGVGIDFEPTGTTYASMDHLTVASNNYGIYVNAVPSSANFEGVLTNSSIDLNIAVGINLNTSATGNAGLAIRDTSISDTNDRNATDGTGILLSGSNAPIVFLSRVLFHNNNVGIQLSAGAAFTTGNNDFLGNGNDVNGGSLTPISPLEK